MISKLFRECFESKTSSQHFQFEIPDTFLLMPGGRWWWREGNPTWYTADQENLLLRSPREYVMGNVPFYSRLDCGQPDSTLLGHYKPWTLLYPLGMFCRFFAVSPAVWAPAQEPELQ